MAAWVKGGAADADAAIDAAAALLAQARMPVIAGLCAELSAIRAAYGLAGAIGASLDPIAGPSLYAELGSLSRSGAMGTTPAEAIGRADALFVVGNAPWDRPIVASLAEGGPTRGRAAGAERTILSLGGPRNGATRHVAYPAEPGGLAIAIAHLRACAKGHLADETAYHDLARRLFAAQYGVVLYAAEEVGEHGVEMLQGLIKDLNETTRFFSLPVSDPFQGRALLQLSAWTTGQAPRVGFGRGLPEHDPWRFDGARQVASGEADAALWLASLPAPRPDWLSRLPSIAIVGEGSADATADAAEIVIAVGVPGASAGGAIWDERRGAIAYIPASGHAAERDAAAVIEAIRDRINAGTLAEC
ncbi:formyltransferase [Methylobacterium iners]|uniref:Formyltransferase/hydrolase complex Fhc subunit B n=1 Tax=Methylobacterium iners TaxID=418707 RepID=A0ABQ4S4R4_9HYPH|nr:formyltransferase [Methylobacterium iners]GJD97387.1 Formyltransferase/hydrolase complex Fhc subunit B [Methylobacterium iners]